MKRLSYCPEASDAGLGGPWLVTVPDGGEVEVLAERAGPTDGITSGLVETCSYQQGYRTREAALAAHPDAVGEEVLR